MACPRSLRLLIIVAGLPGLLSGQSAAQVKATAQVTTKSRAALQQQITKSRGQVVDPRLLRQAPAGNVIATTPANQAPAPSPPSPATEVVRPNLRRGEVVFVRLPDADERAARTILGEKVASDAPNKKDTVQSFPGAVRQLASDDREVQLKPYVLAGQPLQYAADSEQFVGTIQIGVADLFGEGPSRTLTAPLEFQVLESAMTEPDSVSLDRTSPPYKAIEVKSKVLGDVKIRIASNFSREGFEVKLPIEPTLLVQVDGGNLRGLGMQTTRVTVRAVGGGAPGKGTPVDIAAPGATLESVDATLDESGIAHAVLRSDSTGEVNVKATASGYAPGSKTVTVIWPWFTLAAACVGGLIGGFVRLSTRMRKGANIGQIILGLVVSIFLGAIVFALQVGGVKLLMVTFSVATGDIVAFGIGALAGWLGTMVLPKASS
jgi:hypothetical protein